MIFISSKTANYLRCCFLFTLSFYMIKDPQTITDQPLLILFGQAMNVERGVINDLNEKTLGLVSLLFFSLGLIDFMQLLVDNVKYFESIIPLRLTIFFGIASYSYMIPTSPFHNDLVFSYSFLEIWFNFLLYNVIREEKHKRNQKFEKKLESELLQVQQGKKSIEEVVNKLERTNDI
ncbi:putative membrane protein [Wickerhamomyces ciferrii]|uniref:Membrane protein n=1 Tax=Wickerhamomyces ciferrii (strain ATCC 14091 / BCRC 22168 / CBS 111 / JCM 3599 / NBRC 0793 / NRRL Y-1031 F-60-10) TaxID=1206466 RepID=K0KTY1_WICCF|nr:uncharacterized protein BN7_4418 [Wickerhamomyces ciferrii]CCH44849.1 putative membrane protein [Wickerhamomyces ciferrii]